MAIENSAVSTSPPDDKAAVPKKRKVTMPQRRWFQFSLRTLLVFMLLGSIGLYWFSVKLQQAKKQRQAVEAILDLGGSVVYDYEWDEWAGKKESLASAWLRSLFGDDLFHEVETVKLRWVQGEGVVVGEADRETRLSALEEFGGLRQLDLHFGKVTDADLQHVNGLAQLEDLKLEGTQVTDAGLEHLKQLTNLRKLNLDSIKITDAGLVHLVGLTRLNYLSLGRSPITDEGLEHLQGLTELEELYLHSTKVTDVGLQHLKGLANLQSLSLSGTEITDAGLVHLKGLTKLEDLSLGKTPVTDAGLEHLKGLNKLRNLHLLGTQVTDEGVKKLQEALPNCVIEHY